jgi:uncharacterized protein (TIGR02611 family)
MQQALSVLRWIGRGARRIAVTVVGGALLAAGAVMVVTPGPGLAAIVLGLVVLATEYVWARRALERARDRARRTADRIRRRDVPRGTTGKGEM